MKSRPLAEYELTLLTRWNSQLEKADVAFLAAHVDLFETDENMEDEQYQNELEEHQAAVDAASKDFAMLKCCLQVKSAARRLEAKLSTLETSMPKGYNSSHAEAFTKIANDIDAFQDLVTEDGVSEHPCVMALQTKVMDHWYIVQQVRSDSGHFGPPIPATPVVASSSSSDPKVQALSVELPMFSGRTTEFRDFKRLFLSILERQKHLSDDEKKALLLKSMTTPDSKDQARIAMKQTAKFGDAMALFSQRYENSREIVAHHLQEFHKMPFLDQNSDDIETISRYIADEMKGIQAAQCIMSGQLMVAYMDTHFKPLLRTAWRTKTAKLEDPPDLHHLEEFLREQLDIVSRPVDMNPEPKEKKYQPKPKRSPKKKAPPSPVKRERSSSPEQYHGHSHSPSSSRSPSPVRRSVFQATKSRRCSYCQADHNTFSCHDFKALRPQERQDWVKEAKRCYNCLGERHLAVDCRSERRCQECNSNHHTLLHIPKQSKSSSSTSEATACFASISSFKPTAPVTAVAEVSAGNHRTFARLLLDTGAEVTLVSQSFANTLKAPRLLHPPMRIAGMGSVVSQHAVRLALHGDEEVDSGDETLYINARVL